MEECTKQKKENLFLGYYSDPSKTSVDLNHDERSGSDEKWAGPRGMSKTQPAAFLDGHGFGKKESNQSNWKNEVAIYSSVCVYILLI